MSVLLLSDTRFFEGGDVVNFTVSIDIGDPIELEIDWGDGNITTYVGLSKYLV